MSLRISRGLELSVDFATQTCAILAQRRKGKTYTASVIAEEMVGEGQPFVVLDPTGAWWGLRSSADGKKAGLPVIVIGGQHGDVPLERGAGKLVADLVVDSPAYYVLDLSLTDSNAAQREFATDFAERFYRRKRPGTDPIHLFVDEADMFAPQRPLPGDQRMLGAFEAIVRRGGIRGIGSTLITQRAAVLNKNVLEQIDVLIVLRVAGPNDRKAIDGYVVSHGTDEQRSELMGSLAALELGEAWIWEPGADVFKRVKIRQRRTFNSSATPKAGERHAEPRKLADVDLDVLRERMAQTIAKQHAADPRHLQRRVKELEAQLANVKPERVEIPVLADDARQALEQGAQAIEAAKQQMIDAIAEASATLTGLVEQLGARPAPPARAPSPPKVAAATAPAAPAHAHDYELGDFRPTPAQQRILNALAMLEAIGVNQAPKVQLALFADASPKSSGYTNNLGALRSAGLIDYPAPGAVAFTEAGRPYGDAGSAPSTVDELHRYVRQLVGGAKARILDALISVYPEALPKAELATRAGASPTSSGYTNNLGSLRSLGLIDYPGAGLVAAQPVLFLEAAHA